MMFEIGPELAGVLTVAAKAAGVIGVAWAMAWTCNDTSFEIKMRDPEEE